MLTPHRGAWARPHVLLSLAGLLLFSFWATSLLIFPFLADMVAWKATVLTTPTGHELFIQNDDSLVTPGVHLLVSSPMRLPDTANAVVGFVPVVGPYIHHLILLNASTGGPIYAWARTGQRTPIALNLSDVPEPGRSGYVVGAHALQDVQLELHYQQTGNMPVRDNSGLRIILSDKAPEYPLHVAFLYAHVDIPAHSTAQMCRQCYVRRGGAVVGYRVHAHRFARRIWSEHKRGGIRMARLGEQDAQQAQVFHLLPQERMLKTGDTLTVHCEYENDSDNTVLLGYDERTEEMCNHYLLASADLEVDCDWDGFARDGWNSTQMSGCHE
jgi:hypothetical protein